MKLIFRVNTVKEIALINRNFKYYVIGTTLVNLSCSGKRRRKKAVINHKNNLYIVSTQGLYRKEQYKRQMFEKYYTTNTILTEYTHI